MKLSIELDKKLNIMTKYTLNAEEWLFIELLFLATEDEPHPQYMYKYFTECAKKSLPKETLQSLKDKNILAKSYKIPKEGEDFDLEAIEWNNTFIKYYFKESQEAGMELWELYPDFLQINGGDKLLPAKNITRGGFLSLEAFFFEYGKGIKNDPILHKKVLESLKWAIENQLIGYMIPEYVITRKWNDHIKMMESGEVNKVITRFDTMEGI
jgi:hypothetical protein